MKDQHDQAQHQAQVFSREFDIRRTGFHFVNNAGHPHADPLGEAGKLTEEFKHHDRQAKKNRPHVVAIKCGKSGDQGNGGIEDKPKEDIPWCIVELHGGKECKDNREDEV